MGPILLSWTPFKKYCYHRPRGLAEGAAMRGLDLATLLFASPAEPSAPGSKIIANSISRQTLVHYDSSCSG